MNVENKNTIEFIGFFMFQNAKRQKLQINNNPT